MFSFSGDLRLGYGSTKPSFGATIFPQAASLLPYCGVQGKDLSRALIQQLKVVY